MKRVFVLLLCICLMLTAFVGCTEKEPVVEELSGTREAGVLRIGVIVCPPFTYFIDGQWSGFDIALAKDVCTKLGVTPDFIPVEWGDKYSALKNDEVDCLWCGIAVNEDKVEGITYSQSYLASRPVLLTKIGAEQVTTLAAEDQSKAYAAAEAFSETVTVVPAASCVEAVDMIMDGRADGAVVDVLYAIALVNDQVEVSPDADLGMEELAVVFRKGSDLVDTVNRAIADMERTGALKNLAERYSVIDNLIVG